MSYMRSADRIAQLRAHLEAEKPKEMPRPPGLPKTGGRKKGTPNKCRKSIDYFAEQVFKKTDMVQKGMELLEHKDPRVQAMVWCRLMDYKFGRPREQLVISGSVDMRSIVAQARERVLGISNTSKSLPVLDIAKSDILDMPTNQDGLQPTDSIELTER